MPRQTCRLANLMTGSFFSDDTSLLMRNLTSTVDFPSKNDLFISMPCVGAEKLVV